MRYHGLREYGQECRYNQIIDAAIRWTELKLLYGQEVIEQQQGELLEIIRSSSPADCLEGIKRLRDGFSIAAKTLRSMKPDPGFGKFGLWLCDEELDDSLFDLAANGCSVEMALVLLDNTSYWYYAMHNLSAESTCMTDEVKQQTELLKRDIEISDLPYWKLIPTNQTRQGRLSMYPIQEQDLFPWYGLYSEMPPETLLLLAEWLAFGVEAKTEIDVCELVVLWQDVSADKAYRDYLRFHAMMLREMPLAFAEEYALLWQRLAKVGRLLQRLPDNVYAEEAMHISLRLIDEDISSGLPRVHRLFNIACCAYGLPEDARLKIFQDIEKVIKDNPPPKEEMGEALASWFSGDISFGTLCKTVLTNWFKRFNDIVVQTPAPLEEIAQEEYLKILFGKIS